MTVRLCSHTARCHLGGQSQRSVWNILWTGMLGDPVALSIRAAPVRSKAVETFVFLALELRDFVACSCFGSALVALAFHNGL